MRARFVLVVVGLSVCGVSVLIVDLTGTALEFHSRRPISEKHRIGTLARCFICQQGVGVRRAVKCILCSRYCHKSCLSIPDPSKPPCPSCVTITQAAQSTNSQDLVDILNKSANRAEDGFEDEEYSAFGSDSDEEGIEENLSQTVPKMDADSIKYLFLSA